MFTLGFDIYGTLVDPLAMQASLQPLIGEKAAAFAASWREKQIEYAFRRGLMQSYQNFDVCTQQALQYTAHVYKFELSEAQQEGLLLAYRQLPAFEDVRPGLLALKAQGHRMFAFTNGVEASVRDLLAQADLLGLFEEVVSVDDLHTFKPDPRVYQYLSQRGGAAPHNTCLISSNTWDVLGAKGAGIRAAWVRRSEERVFDPWGISPDWVVKDLVDLAEKVA
jgi:2-haloacid dehalogenase